TLDAIGRVVATARAGLDPLQLTYLANGRLGTITQGARVYVFNYNAQGYLASVMDPLNRTVAFGYDPAGRVTTQTFADGRQAGFPYDANGNLASITPPGRPSHDLTFTPVDLLQDYTPPDVGLATEATRYSYDLDKRLTLITRPDGATIGLAYDPAGRPRTITTPGRTVSYTYASAHDATPGSLAQVSTSDGIALSYGYDGRLLTDTTWSGPISGTVHRVYDNTFRVIVEQVNSEPAISFAYDDDDQLIQAGALSLSRDAQTGLLTGTSLGSLTETFTYNPFAEVTDSQTTYAGAAMLLVHLDRDALGRIGQKTESIDGGAIHTYVYQY